MSDSSRAPAEPRPTAENLQGALRRARADIDILDAGLLIWLDNNIPALLDARPREQYCRTWIPPAVAVAMGASARWYRHEIHYTEGIESGKNIHYLDGVRIETEGA